MSMEIFDLTVEAVLLLLFGGMVSFTFMTINELRKKLDKTMPKEEIKQYVDDLLKSELKLISYKIKELENKN